jgi:DNA-binding PadR family transcriptional regulator
MRKPFMSLGYAILAVLADCACSGYDLAKQFDGSVGYFWAATHQQIYRELSRLEKMQWVERSVIEQIDRPNKNIFAITDLGRQEMVRWMGQPSKPLKHKEEILIKVFAGGLMPPEQLVGVLKQERELHRQQLQTYQGIEEKHFSALDNLPYRYRCQHLTLRQGIHHEQSWLDWCEDAIACLEDLSLRCP